MQRARYAGASAVRVRVVLRAVWVAVLVMGGVMGVMGCGEGGSSEGPADAARADGALLDGALLDGALLDGALLDGGGPEADARADDVGPIDMGGMRPEAEAFAARLPGLWSGPATNTPLGAFAVMNMDIRAADARTLFSRFDLDVDDGLRFAFAVEVVEGEPTLVFRNGGYFLGLLRDTRTVLVERAGDRWTFCHRERTCDYLRAVWAFEGDDRLSLTVDVRGMRHLDWPARRLEERTLPDDFAPTPGPHDGPFPPLASIEAEVSWGAALDEATTVWLLVSTTACGLGGACTPARIMSAEAAAGATAVTLRIEQVHPGDYVLNAVLDRNHTFAMRLFPDSGDGLAGLDRRVEVAGETAVDLPVVFDVP